MSEQKTIEARRCFLKFAVGAAATAVLTSGLPRGAQADDLPHLSPADPTAQALGYVEDATKTADARHKPGDICANCQFYTGAATGFGPCQLFPGKAVAARGWCISHIAKQA